MPKVVDWVGQSTGYQAMCSFLEGDKTKLTELVFRPLSGKEQAPTIVGGGREILRL